MIIYMFRGKGLCKYWDWWCH